MNKSKVLTLLFTVSLALNLAFLAAYTFKNIARHRPVPPSELKSDFGLKAEQETKIREIVRKFKINSILFKEDILDKRVEIVEELGNPLYDAEKIARKTEELNQLENQLNRDFIAALLKINDILESDQRLSMLYNLSRNWFFFHHRPEKGGPHE
ncbi:MAG: periplasmic heavy metal sensor [Chrysiogenia bacterium]